MRVYQIFQHGDYLVQQLLQNLKIQCLLLAAQFQHSLVCREPEADLIPASQALGLGMVTWSPLGGGMLTGKYRQGEKALKKVLAAKVFSKKTRFNVQQF